MEQDELETIDPAIHNFMLIEESNGCASIDESSLEPKSSSPNNGVAVNNRKVNETRVITLDTIIRKGLVERMPMTAKDIDNIVPNAIQKERERQDADIQRLKRIAEEQAVAEGIETSEDEVSSEYDSLKNVNVDGLEPPEKEHSNGLYEDVADALLKPRVIVGGEPTSPNRSGSASPLLKPMTEIPNVAFSVDADRDYINEMVPVSDGNNSESDSDTVTFDEESGTDSSNSLKAKKRRRKSTTKRFASTSVPLGDELIVDRPANKRGRPRKIRPPEEEAMKIAKRAKQAEKALRYNGPKRKPGRPKRDDGLGCYPKFAANAKSSVTTPMDELMAMGHSLFSEYGPKQTNRTMRESFELMVDETGGALRPQDLLEISEVIPSTHRAEMRLLEENDESDARMPIEGMLQVQHNTEADDPVVFRRKPGRPKIDRESGGRIVFQNSELTVVNKFNKSIKTELDERQQASSSTVSQDSFDERQHTPNSFLKTNIVKSEIEILPITNTNRFVLPKDTTIQASGSRKPYKNVTVLNFGDGSRQIHHQDDMLEVRRVDGFEALHPLQQQPKKRGPKPKTENYYARNLYADYSKHPIELTNPGFPEPKKRGRKPKSLFAPMNIPNVPNAPRMISSTPLHSRPSISLKNINELLAVPSASSSTPAATSTPTPEMTGKRIRKPKNMDFPYDLTPTVRKSLPGPVALQQLQIQRLQGTAAQLIDPLNQQKLVNRLIAKPNRDKRLSGNRPKYAESSESSSDNQDSTNTTPKPSTSAENTTPAVNPYTSNTEIKPMKSGKLHWKTQLKVQRMLREGIKLPLEIINQSLPAIQQQHKLQLQQKQQQQRLNQSAPLPDLDISLVKQEPNEYHSLDFSMENVEVTPDITIGEEREQNDAMDHDGAEVDESVEGKKRIPKLKFDSFNFSDRRDKFSNKPRMVLKYKKKYKKKVRPLLPTTMMMMGEDGIPVPVNGPNRTQQVGEVVRQKWARKQQFDMLAAVTKVKRKYTKRNLLTSHAEPDENTTVRPDRCDSGLDPTTANDLPATNKIHDENKVLQDRNKILLEILEQRSAEIRNLKLRVSNMVKTTADEETEGVESNAVTNSNTKICPNRDEPPSDDTAWSQAELAKAYSLQKLSRPLYAYVQDRFSLPLPAPTEVSRFITELNVTRGILQHWLQILEFDGEIMTELDRVTVLQISQVPLQSIYEYDIDMDTIVGPYRSMTVIVARGLYSGWAQAVFADFDTANLKGNVTAVIEELHKIKFPVVACACKYVNDETATSTWTELGISAGCNYFSHPVTTDFIYAFYYIDDLLLTMHQYFLSDGFSNITDQSTARSTIERLLLIGDSVPITNAILQPKADIKQAVQLFSSETATLLRCCLADDEAAVACAKHLDVIGAFYQLMCSKNINDDTTHQSKLPYGKDLEYQNNILNEIQLHFYKVRSAGSPKMAEFQRATMQSIESLKMLQHSTKQRYKADSFATDNITGEYFNRNRLSASSDSASGDTLTPLRAFRIVKEIFLQPTPKLDDDHMAMPNETCFYEADMDATAHSEDYYVHLLIEWIADKYKDKHPYDEFVAKMNKIEEMFVTIQGSKFQIVEGAVTSVFKKIKSHKFGMFLEVIHTFVVQRHLLRIKYYNAAVLEMTN